MKHGSERVKLDKIPPKEPVFIIRGQDKLGPTILRLYASMYEQHEGYSKVIASEIKAQAQNMESWQLRKGISKIAD